MPAASSRASGTLDEVGREILALIQRVAAGDRTCSEALGTRSSSSATSASSPSGQAAFRRENPRVLIGRLGDAGGPVAACAPRQEWRHRPEGAATGSAGVRADVAVAQVGLVRQAHERRRQ